MVRDVDIADESVAAALRIGADAERAGDCLGHQFPWRRLRLYGQDSCKGSPAGSGVETHEKDPADVAAGRCGRRR